MLVHISYGNGDNEYFETGYFRIYEADDCYETGNSQKEPIEEGVRTIHIDGKLVYMCRELKEMRNRANKLRLDAERRHPYMMRGSYFGVDTNGELSKPE